MEWISVETRIPNSYEPVLICAEDTSIQGGIVYLVGTCKNGCWFLQNAEAKLGFPNLQYKVTDWMEIPRRQRRIEHGTEID